VPQKKNSVLQVNYRAYASISSRARTSDVVAADVEVPEQKEMKALPVPSTAVGPEVPATLSGVLADIPLKVPECVAPTSLP